MTSLLALAALGSWSYAGFLEEPGVGPTPAPPIPAPAPEKPRPPAPTPAPEPDPARPEIPEIPPAVDRPAVPEDPKPPAPRVEAAIPPAAPPAPARYRLSDASGQVWEHPDSSQLRSFVESRNRSFSAAPAYYYYPAATATYSSCANGRCR